LGTEATSTVYAAELQGISLALQIAQDYAERNGSRRKVAIYTDNQAAIWSIAKAEGRTGSYILEEIARQVQELQKDGQTVTVRWIPAHVGISGNESADQAAKEATGWRPDGLSKRESSVLVQLRMGKIELNDFLFTRKVPEVTSPACPCEERRQTVTHTYSSVACYTRTSGTVSSAISSDGTISRLN
jgi:ribonuclease HI